MVFSNKEKKAIKQYPNQDSFLVLKQEGSGMLGKLKKEKLKKKLRLNMLL
jgi:hypothetical protein